MNISDYANKEFVQLLVNNFFKFALFITSLITFVPFLPNMPSEGLDASWIIGMNQALSQGLVFGKDIIFTFGPYASIYTKSYHPASDHIMLWGSIYFSISFYVAAFYNFKNSTYYIQLILLIILNAFILSPDTLFFFYALLVGIFIFRLTSLSQFREIDPRSCLPTLIVLLAPLGLLPLIKGSMLIASVMITFFSTLLLLIRRRIFFAFIVYLTPVLSMVFFWICAGQSLNHLPIYFVSMLPIISGYSAAMSLNGNPSEILLYVFSSLILIFLVFFNNKISLSSRLIVCLIYTGILFLAFKAGFVRHDGHALNASGTLLVACVLASSLISPMRSATVIILSLITWNYIDISWTKSSPSTIWTNSAASYAGALAGIKTRIYNSAQFENAFNTKLAEIQSRTPLPKLSGTVDLYPFDQSSLIASGNKWNPRPILQSYSAYTPALAEINKNHLLETNRPDSIFFKSQPIDNRFPALEDGPSWPALIANYEPASLARDYILLKYRSAGDSSSLNFGKIYSARLTMGEKIELPDTPGLIYAKLNFKMSLLGKILNSFFKPSEINILVNLKDGRVKLYRMISGMADTGFILSPLIETTDDFSLLFAGPHFLEQNRVGSIILQPVSDTISWQRYFDIEFYSINYRGNPSLIDDYNLWKANASSNPPH